MREYKFRAKCIDESEYKGQLIYGFGVHKWDDDGVERAELYTPNGIFEVDPETVGQYATEGKYEGDIIEFEDMGEEGYEYKEGYDFTNRAVIFFENGRFTLDEFMDTNSGVLEEIDDHEATYSVIQHGRVVGNRWDNPELLGG